MRECWSRDINLASMVSWLGVIMFVSWCGTLGVSDFLPKSFCSDTLLVELRSLKLHPAF